MTRAAQGAAIQAVAAVAGGALVLAFPPFDLWPLAALAPAPLCYLAVDGRISRNQAIGAGLTFGLAAFGGTVYWIVPVMHTFGGLPEAVAVGVLLVLVAYLAAFPAAFAAVLWRVSRRLGPLAALIVAPAAWAALELARDHVLTGFPWARLGTSLHAAPSLLQLASLTGVYGLSALLLSIAAAAAALVAAPGRQATVYAGAVAVVSVATALYGAARLRTPPTGESFPVACVQGNVDQARKWDAGEAERILDRHLRLTEEAARDGARLIVWPESSMPYALRSHPTFARQVQELAAHLQVTLVVGSLDRRADGDVFNSAFLIGPAGEIEGVYDKQHLVPFGEYVPWSHLLTFAESLVEQVGNLEPGSGTSVIGGPGVPRIGVEICYEIIFPELARRAAADGAELLVNLTNDAWFGRSSAPYQHFAEAVVRAVEVGRPVVRAANTGISGIIDDRGRVLARSALGEAIVVSGAVRPATGETPYVRVGDAFAWACAILAAAALAVPVAAAPSLESRPW